MLMLAWMCDVSLLSWPWHVWSSDKAFDGYVSSQNYLKVWTAQYAQSEKNTIFILVVSFSFLFYFCGAFRPLSSLFSFPLFSLGEIILNRKRESRHPSCPEFGEKRPPSLFPPGHLLIMPGRRGGCVRNRIAGSGIGASPSNLWGGGWLQLLDVIMPLPLFFGP